MEQAYNKYTNEDFQVWKILFERQMPNIRNHACQTYKDALNNIQFKESAIPNFEAVNELLIKTTGWSISVVPSIVPIRDFFLLLSNKKFPSTTWLRSMKQLDYLEEPDMFHDAFGHMPMLTNQDYCAFLTALSEIALQYIDNPKALELLGRLYWFTIEFGLVIESNIPTILGAGLISSFGEAIQSVESETVIHVPFQLEVVLKTPYINSSMQQRYFVLKSMSEMYKTIQNVAPLLEEILASDYEVEVSGMVM